MPATIVGRANGRAIRAWTRRLPGNSPRTSAAPPRVPVRIGPAAPLAANRDPDLLLDACEDAAVLVEELLAHVAPAAQVGDGEQPRRLGEVRARRDLLVHRV